MSGAIISYEEPGTGTAVQLRVQPIPQAMARTGAWETHPTRGASGRDAIRAHTCLTRRHLPQPPVAPTRTAAGQPGARR